MEKYKLTIWLDDLENVGAPLTVIEYAIKTGEVSGEGAGYSWEVKESI